jgi:hypothetical protein
MSLLSDLLNDAKVYRGRAHNLMRRGLVRWAKDELRAGLYSIRQAKRLLGRTDK